MKPNLFTVILRSADCLPAIVQGLDVAGITAVALGAHPVDTVEAFPAQWRDGTATAREIEDHATQGILARAVPGGFKVEFLGSGEPTAWADEVIRALDLGKRQERAAARAAKIAEAVGTPKQADRATARAVDILSHAKDAKLFELEQRARLVGA